MEIPNGVTFPTASITRAAAALLLDAARAAANDLGIEITTAITDAGGHLKSFDRMDGAPFLTVDAAMDKAWTAAAFRLATHEWVAILANPEVAQLAHRPRFLGVGGGYPIVQAGTIVGAIGTSGGNAKQDQHIAEVALRALGFDAPTAT